MNYAITKCRTLKEIRKRIADANGIDYTPAECPHEKECLTGTCPACEAEAEYIEKELEKRGTFKIDGIEK